ncbi:hypothetical protein [Mammaliicoccus sciuri]|uniref:hypothetical protein n=1 Tax=Mammaliicoccus sciuri TaxID=1296 RepID=UPI002DBCB679|nr:hypothetical protein [Mammaliicoccus sciuri]MEB7816741.1 hypothetical protein [Mammaliicoccus sciuri]
MKINIQGFDIQGTPNEIKDLINLVNQEKIKEDYDVIKSRVEKPKILLCKKNF